MPSSQTDIASIAARRSAIAAGTLRVADAIAADLAAIARDNGRLNAFVGPAPAFEMAIDGPLAGIGIGVKDNIDVRGLPATAGLVVRQGIVARVDAPCVARLRAAGATILGKTNLPDGGLGPTTDNVLFGRTPNPHVPARSSGGSSGGSAAAVAAGLCLVALGTDTLGSVRIPASYCGVVGFKPGYGRIGLDGVYPLTPSLDTVGVLANSCSDAAAVYGVLADQAVSSAIVGIILVPDEVAQAACEPDVAAAFADLIELLCGQGHTIARAPLGLDLAKVRQAGFMLSIAAARDIHPIASRASLSPAVRAVLDYADHLTSADLQQAEATVQDVRARLATAFTAYAFILTPTTPQTAFDDSGRPPRNAADFTAPASVAHLPALSLPIGWDGAGLPVAAQLIGARDSEWSLLGLGGKIEAALAAQRNGKAGGRFSRRAASPSR